jgi:hypothetical protein
MKRVLFVATAAALAAAAWGSPPQYEYEGMWGERGTGNGQFDLLSGIAIAPNNNVYVVDARDNERVQYFTPTG